MVFNNLIPRSGLPNRHESSAMRSMRDGDSIPNQWKKNQATSDRTSQIVRSLSVVQRQVNVIRRRIVGGGVTSGAFRWAAAGRIYSKDNSYSGDKTSAEEVWVAPDADVVVTGVTDPDTNLTVKSYPGVYRALQAVAPIAGTPTKYHIPLPYLPVPGDIDDPKNYWQLISPEANCLV